MASRPDVTETLVAYMAAARTAPLPPQVLTRAKHHLLDTLAAMISGTTIKPGRFAIEFARLSGGGKAEAQVIGSDLVLPAVPAAIANGMLGHADETDDSNGPGGMHPGCSVLPAALAMAEREDASGRDFINATMAGYDVGARVVRALGREEMRNRNHLPFSIGGAFGAAAAAGCLAGLTRPEQYRHLLSYAAQQASGIMTYARDTEHIEKAFVFGGMPARNGLTAALMVQAGFTGVDNVFDGFGNFLIAYADKPNPGELVGELGVRYEVMNTNIKKFAVGFPIQAALEALLGLIAEHDIRPDQVDRILARLTRGGAITVNDREMPSINLQYLFAVGLIDRDVGFEAAHDLDRMRDPRVMELRKKTTVEGDPSLADENYSAIVDITLGNGKTLSKRVDSFRGKAENPLTTEEVEHKARALIEPALGAKKAKALIETVRDLEKLPKVRDLRPLLSTTG